LTIELLLSPSNENYIIAWGESQDHKCEILANEETIKKILKLSKEYSIYQQEPFCLGCSHHKWIWYYEEYIPPSLHKPSPVSIPITSLHFDHYGKSVMQAYVVEKLKSKEIEFTSIENTTVCILTWNAAGNSPKGNLLEWFLCRSKKFNKEVQSPDIIFIGLQEMCELTKLLGDQTRQQEWVDYLGSQACTAFQEKYVNV
jgi:hypothetical protein